MNVYPKVEGAAAPTAEFTGNFVLKVVLDPESPSLIGLRPPCTICEERAAMYRFLCGSFGFCRECRPQQTDPDAEFHRLYAAHQRHVATPMSLESLYEICEKTPFVSPQTEHHMKFTEDELAAAEKETDFWANFLEEE